MLIHADCIQAMSKMEPSSIDAIVTDPPYGLEFMGKEWDKLGATASDFGESLTDDGRVDFHGKGNAPFGGGGKRIRYGSSAASVQAWHQSWATEALRVLKPGGSLLSFGGTRTFHRLTCGLEDAGFTIKDCLMYLYGAGFPKAQDAANVIRKRYCRCGEQETEHDLRPVRNPDIPQGFDASDKSGEVLFAGLQEQGASTEGAEAGDGDAGFAESSVEGWGDVLQAEGQLQRHSICAGSRMGVADGEERRLHNGTPPDNGDGDGETIGADRSRASSRPRSNEQRPDEFGALADELSTQESGVEQVCPECSKPFLPDGLAESWDGYKIGGIKPSWEPIIWAVKPPEGAWIDNVLKYGTGAVNVDETRIGTEDMGGYAVPAGGMLQPSNQRKSGYRPKWDREDRGFVATASKGRFPANLLLSHTPDCREVGTKRVKGITGGTAKASAFPTTHGEFNGHKPFNLADPDGYETISAWECAEDCPVRLLDEQSGVLAPQGSQKVKDTGDKANTYGGGAITTFFGDTGGASRFFYTSKATDRADYNDHPTLKPTDLIEWLVRLVTRPGQLVLDPFAGSGTTGVAAIQSGREFILIEQDEHYCDIAERRTTDGPQQGMF